MFTTDQLGNHGGASAPMSPCIIKRGLELRYFFAVVAVRKSSLAFLCTAEKEVRGQELVRGWVEQGFLRLVEKLRGVLRQRVPRQLGMLILPHHQQHLPSAASATRCSGRWPCNVSSLATGPSSLKAGGAPQQRRQAPPPWGLGKGLGKGPNFSAGLGKGRVLES